MEPNSFTKTSFCGTEIDNITINETKEYILNQLNIFCSGIKYNSRYAKVFNQQYSKNLNNPHVFFLKTSGTPYLLFLTQINNTNYCFLIDKKTNNKYNYPKILIVPYDFHNDLYKGTLFECELIKDKNNNWLLGINDIYCSEGKNLNKVIIIDRINTVNSILDTKFKQSNYSNICPIFVKKYFDYNLIRYVKDKFIPSLPYNIRGIYFIPLRVDYSNILYLFSKSDGNSQNMNTMNTIIKNNTNTMNTMNNSNQSNDTKVFRIMKTMKPDVYELYLKDNNNLIKKGIALIQTTELSQKVLSYFKDKDPTIEVKVECNYDKHFKKWKPVRFTNKEISSD